MGEIWGDFHKLPEACVAHVLSLSTPRDACRSAAVSAAYRSAADSETVWERFLPSDLKEILDRTAEIVTWSSKRDLYFQLCDPILIDGGKMSFHLDKSSGAKCYMISSKELAITRVDDPYEWRWAIGAELGLDGRFPEVAYIIHARWLEIHGKIKTRMLSPNTNYAAYLVFKIDSSQYGFSDPVQVASVKIGSHESKRNVHLYLHPSMPPQGRLGLLIMQHRYLRGMAGNQDKKDLDDCRVPSTRADGWKEIKMGDFFTGHGGGDDDDDEVDICLMDDVGGQMKRELFVLGIEVRPNYR